MTEYGKDNKYRGKEASLQASCYKICQHLPGSPVAFHVANERKTSVITTSNGRKVSPAGARLKAQGVVAGIPDLIIAEARGGYFGLAVELKVFGGKLSDHQELQMQRFEDKGWYVALVWSIDGFLKLIDHYWSLEPMYEVREVGDLFE